MRDRRDMSEPEAGHAHADSVIANEVADEHTPSHRLS